MNLASRCRFKYSSSGGWGSAGPEEAQSPHRAYLHPDSPATGEYWMSQGVSFGRLKLTNTSAPPAGQMVLSSMHKYQPRIIICKTSDPRALPWAPSSSVVFPDTQFIAVTAYQNDKITKLKIDNNPFAKGFRVNGQSKCKRKRLESEKSIEEEQKPAKQINLEPISPLRLEDDRSSTCSSSSGPASPEEPRQRKSPSEAYHTSRYQPYSHIYSHQPFPPYPLSYYQPYSYPLAMWSLPQPFFYPHAALPTEKPTMAKSIAQEKPKKVTDFSIRAITGCSWGFSFKTDNVHKL